MACHLSCSPARATGGGSARPDGSGGAACAANEDIPCQFDWRTLLVGALGHARLGHEHEAHRLYAHAAASGVGGPLAQEPALLRLALLTPRLRRTEHCWTPSGPDF